MPTHSIRNNLERPLRSLTEVEEERSRTSRAWLRERLGEAPYVAVALLGEPRPTDCVLVSRCSAVVRRGERVWLFRKESERDTFVRQYPSSRASTSDAEGLLD